MKKHKDLVNEWALSQNVTTAPKVWGLLQRACYGDTTPADSSLAQLRAALDTYSVGSRASVASAFNAYVSWLRSQGMAMPDFKGGDRPLPVAAIATLFSAIRQTLPGFALDAFRSIRRDELDLGYPGAYRGVKLQHAIGEDTWARACKELLSWSMTSQQVIPAEPGGGYAIPEGRLREALVKYRESQT